MLAISHNTVVGKVNNPAYDVSADAWNEAHSLLAVEIAVTGATTATVGGMHVCSGTSADYTVTLPTASGNTGKFIGFRMSIALTKFVTLDGNASETIDGQTTRLMWARETAILLSNGSEWVKLAGLTYPMICIMRPNAVDSATNGGFTKLILNQADLDNTGTMANTSTNRITVRRNGNYNVAAVIAYAGTSASVNRAICFIIKNNDGIILRQAEVSALTSGNPHPLLVSVAPFTAGDFVELFTYQDSGASQIMLGQAVGDSSILTLTEMPTW